MEIIVKRYYKDDFQDIINECESYIEQCEDMNQKKEYQEELKNVTDFYDLVYSGIFHDAIGKLMYCTINSVDVTTEY